MEDRNWKKMSNHGFNSFSTAQVRELPVHLQNIYLFMLMLSKTFYLGEKLAPSLQMNAHYKHKGRPSTLSSRLARHVTHLKQKVVAHHGSHAPSTLHGRETPGGEDDFKSHCRNERKGEYRGRIFIVCLFSSTNEIKHSFPAVNPSDLQQDWAPGLNVKRKRGRKPKVLMSDDRPYHKELKEDKSDSESSVQGELQGWETQIFPVRSLDVMTLSSEL